jgi:hypothetical protein
VSDLVEFLRAALDEEDAVARATAWSLSTQIYNAWEAVPPEDEDGAWRLRQAGKNAILLHCESEEITRHIASHNPDRVLRAIAAKRQLVDAYAEVADMDTGDDAEPEFAYGRAAGLGIAVRLLALTYADRPGYLPKWAPAL